MGFLGFGKKLDGAAKRIGGQTDILEACCSSAALLAAADGNISDEEVASAIQTVKNNETLSNAFDARTIETTMDKMLARAKGGFSGRNGLMKEINDIAQKDFEVCETVYLIALDVAHADGEVGEKEQQVLNKIASALKIDPNKYAA